MYGVDEVLIIGATARAAAFSAYRAGLRPRCMDLFADTDLAERWPVARFDPDRDADDLERTAASFGCPHWLYTGSMEGRPDLVERLSGVGRRLGNGPEVLRRVRDPWLVSASLGKAGLPAPELRIPAEARKSAGRWLRKSRVSAGGVSVQWEGAATNDPGPDDYCQRFIEGETYSALFVAAAGKSRLIGTALQLPGPPDTPFLYGGNIAPWPVGGATETVRRVGDVLAADFGLVGLFGVDFILNDDVPWTIEVNPRYTASVELYEAVYQRPFLADHIRACLNDELGMGPRPLHDAWVYGKAVVYAPCRLRFQGENNHDWQCEDYRPPWVADLPAAGTVIEAGEPVLTILRMGRTAQDCRERLEQSVKLRRERLERSREA
ncbi:ATP-grasp domain-containing protein [Paludisphaera rhizosphaerae]|uniref:ATP-grasp domain-containing protein n=1 Tax=Paludisphaera rhizosphaerae TaxID=2711216 RepID=UPI0013EBFFED|nr:ATP-grasp domain-containing protein [Paludisphaera rhizosphaerae]